MELSLTFTIFYNDSLVGQFAYGLRHRKRIDVDDCLSREGEDAS